MGFMCSFTDWFNLYLWVENLVTKYCGTAIAATHRVTTTALTFPSLRLCLARRDTKCHKLEEEMSWVNVTR